MRMRLLKSLAGSALLAAMAPVGPSAAQDAEVVKVGPGRVIVAQTGSREDVALDEAERAAASAELGGRSIGIVLIPPPGGTLPTDTPVAQGAKAAVEALGGTAVFCEAVQFRRRQARCGRENVDALVALQYFPGETFTAPAQMLRRGLAVVVVGAPGQRAPTDGSVRLREDPAAYGLGQGRAAGAWAAAAWPDTDVTVAIRPAGPAPDPFYDAVAAGVLESLPGATIAPHSLEPLDTIDANLYTGAVRMEDVGISLAAGMLGVTGQPVAIFPLSCPDPLPTGPEFAGCLRLGYEDVGAAAIDVIATLTTGGQVPAEIVSGPTVEVVPGE